ncbi:hypothetical protein Y032_0132g1729 [Ancylostoma ceylanicum]|uniref:Uncharacterized protein n=1 Tax=Ancylostoma ceylanicum TaxID=53326 RepID=A0A016T5S5_9BILA|nr:hypothetical protein Y032_0132g1729 [Ancylostoma ceylanicum]
MILYTIAMCFYGVGIVTAFPIWYLMITKQFLHTNFRTLIFIITVGAHCACVLTYVIFLCQLFGYKNECERNIGEEGGPQERHTWVGKGSIRGMAETSLHRYQDKENGRTAAVYTCISLNELLCSVATVGVYALLLSAHAKSDIIMGIVFDNSLELIDSYRIMFINVTILLNCFLWSRRQNKVFIEKQCDHGDQYFLQLQNSWEGPRQNSAGQTKS